MGFEYRLEFCKMDIRPIFFQEICFTISLKNWPDSFFAKGLRFGREKS